MKLDILKEKALTNIILLFDFWKLDYTKVNEDEYDFINPTRSDKNFGACRFNIRKGLGADFTGRDFTESDFKQIGMGLSREDFGNIAGRSVSSGFDIIGLCQRLYNVPTYRAAAELLSIQLADIGKNQPLQKVSLAAAIKRQQASDEARHKKLITARRIWGLCSGVEGTLGENYLKSRNIILKKLPEAMRFHAKILNMEVRQALPALLFKVSESPTSELTAIHRVYLRPDGFGKANLKTQKSALGEIKGSAIWFGKDDEKLCIVEGPENALTILALGYTFVVSTINAVNYPYIHIPDYVRNVILFPDGDSAGRKAAELAIKNYSVPIRRIKIVFPPKKEDNPKWDWNDELQNKSRGNGKKEK